jgi:hypothetical protein
MPATEIEDDRQSIVAAGVRLAFTWTRDRWSHVLECDGLAIVRSIEADLFGDDPALSVSPAYQQLGFQAGVGCVHALLVGQSGTHHYSAAFTVREDEGAVTVEVDVADRGRAAPAPLACTYWVGVTSSDLRDADSARVVWSPAGLGGELRFASDDPETLVTLAECGRSATQVQACAPVRPDTQTLRCRYRWIRSA